MNTSKSKFHIFLIICISFIIFTGIAIPASSILTENIRIEGSPQTVSYKPVVPLKKSNVCEL